MTWFLWCPNNDNYLHFLLNMKKLNLSIYLIIQIIMTFVFFSITRAKEQLLIFHYSAPNQLTHLQCNQFTCQNACLLAGLNSDKKGVKKTMRLGEEIKDNTRSKSIFTWPVIFLCSTHTNNVNHRPLVMLWNIIILCCWKYNLTAVPLCKPILIWFHALIKPHNFCCCDENWEGKFENGETIPSGGTDGA